MWLTLLRNPYQSPKNYGKRSIELFSRLSPIDQIFFKVLEKEVAKRKHMRQVSKRISIRELEKELFNIL